MLPWLIRRIGSNSAEGWNHAISWSWHTCTGPASGGRGSSTASSTASYRKPQKTQAVGPNFNIGEGRRWTI